MKFLIAILLFGFCMTDELNTDIKCKCNLRLFWGHRLETLTLTNGSIPFSDKCNSNDFTLCTDACNQQISNETNNYDLNKPKVGADNSDVSLGQQFCDHLRGDINNQPIYLSVTLKCDIKLNIVANNQTIGTSVSESSISRFMNSGFNQTLTCIGKKFTEPTSA
ncbi:uncharacterized protein LOC128961371 [Oppia nitens]|uniref:uncharacterized protein LOC128961371 n=1 Tax=Oppia nitens TaxID=1686743 RepID=UPI0023D98FA3|nr:uncharacterized protein LOC128961371 [Oppia nitens]